MTKPKKHPALLLISLLVLAALACNSALNLPALLDQEGPSVQEEASAPTPPVENINLSTELMSQEAALISLYEEVGKGVVSIQVVTALGAGQGSGFVYDDQGHIITNYHVVEAAEYIEVAFTSGYRTTGEVIAVDTDSDLAVIRVEAPAEELHPLVLGDSDELRVGQIVVAIGNPFGLTGSMSTGIVSSLGRSMDSLNEAPGSGGRFFAAGDLIQTDAAINPGNSGGPLLNLQGEVVGINRAIRTFNFSETGDSLNSGIGFAVSINIAKRVVPALISVGHYDYPYLGLSSRGVVTLAEAQQLGLDRTTGALVSDVVPGGPADEAGLQPGDLIIAVDGQDVLTFDGMIAYLFGHTSPGDTIRLDVLRQDEIIQIDLVLGARP